MKNILGFPVSTVYGKPVLKKTFYKHMEMNSKMKQHFVDDVAEINWLYKLAPSTLNVSDGKRVHEIVVFVVRLKAKDCPLDVFTFIDKMMPRFILFVLEYEGEYRLLLNYKEAADADGATFRISRSFVSEWTSCGDGEDLAALHLSIEGNDMEPYMNTLQEASLALARTAMPIPSASSSYRHLSAPRLAMPRAYKRRFEPKSNSTGKWS